MATITTKLLSANVDPNGTATLVLEFNDGKGTWSKTYNISQTEPIDFAKFKERVVADLRRDLQVKAQLTSITAQVGKTFTLTI